jgi:hypothetical protein
MLTGRIRLPTLNTVCVSMTGLGFWSKGQIPVEHFGRK